MAARVANCGVPPLYITHPCCYSLFRGVWPPVQALAAARPRWIDHLLLNEIFDGDMAYLAQASANAKKKDGYGASWAQDYYLPARADG